MVISPAGFRSGFPQQPGLKVAISQRRYLLVVVSPSRVGIVVSPAGQRLLVSPQSALVVLSPTKSPSGSGAEEVFPDEGGPFLAAVLFPSGVEIGVLSSSSAECLELPRRVP